MQFIFTFSKRRIPESPAFETHRGGVEGEGYMGVGEERVRRVGGPCNVHMCSPAYGGVCVSVCVGQWGSGRGGVSPAAIVGAFLGAKWTLSIAVCSSKTVGQIYQFWR